MKPDHFSRAILMYVHYFFGASRDVYLKKFATVLPKNYCPLDPITTFYQFVQFQIFRRITLDYINMRRNRVDFWFLMIQIVITISNTDFKRQIIWKEATLTYQTTLFT